MSPIFISFVILYSSLGSLSCQHLTTTDWITRGQSTIRSSTVIDHRSLMRDFWTWRLHEVPEFASALGTHRHDSRLESFTLEAFQHRKEKCEVFLAISDHVDLRRMTPDDVTSLILLRHDLRTYIDGYQWIFHSSLNSINDFEGIHKDFTYWIDSMKFEREDSFKNYINRLRALVTQIHEQINLMKDAIRYGLASHRLSLQTVVNDIMTSVGDRVQADRTPFFKPFNESLEYARISPNKAELLRLEGISVIQDDVIAAYRKLAHFIRHEYLKKTRPLEGVGSLPGGTRYYEACLRWYLTPPSDITASSLHQLGRKTVDSLLSRIDTLRQRIGFHGKLEEFMKHAHGANKLFYRTAEELLQGYQDIVETKIPSKLLRLFYQPKMSNVLVQPMPFDGPAAVLLPGITPNGVESTSEELSYPSIFFVNVQDPLKRVQPMPFDGPAAVLLPGITPNGVESTSEELSYPSIFFVNVQDPLKRPKWQMYVTALRETTPGRHLQTSYAQNQSLPEFRKWREYRKMFSVPFQFPFNTAYTEGWALYAEWLGYELDLFNNPYDQFGQLHSELYKACEMVVDTGIHIFGWTAADSVDYLIRTTGIPRSKAELDVQRIVTFPGQAVAPEYGLMRLQWLRRSAEKALGDRFNIREFHHQILRLGPVPLNVLELKLQQWYSPGGTQTYGKGCGLTASDNQTMYLVTIIASCVVIRRTIF